MNVLLSGGRSGGNGMHCCRVATHARRDISTTLKAPMHLVTFVMRQSTSEETNRFGTRGRRGGGVEKKIAENLRLLLLFKVAGACSFPFSCDNSHLHT